MTAFLPLRAWADDHGTDLTPAQAYAKLVAGNDDFVAGKLRPAADQASIAGLAAAQNPWATVVCCSDSRVPPELIFQTGFGELFVVRNAGNTAATSQSLGSVEYSVYKFHTPLIIVLGHSKCGAVEGATAVVQSNGSAVFPGSIGPMVEPIVPAALAARTLPGDPVVNGVRENVIRVRDRLRSPEQPVLFPPYRRGDLAIVGAIYDLDTRHVTFLDPIPSAAH
ncbi:carbonic anhydrase [Sphingomonas sp. LB-2]|uniref:carbonic anhydrase n=1 Tax=Sphingomonas caeni TaxID=2984949 RepID=UPI00222F391E|nr:carbonic anhydrase [Sphingomonas caeni]MCW3848988.1 carbonic anhydrase [Sphingomonas caeni]